jgi:CheY-like chemotaxis protein
MKHVLIIDDSDTDVFICRKLFELLGLNPIISIVKTARDGILLLEKLKKYPEKIPDLILLELILPVSDGFYFLNQFCPRSFPTARVVVVTVMDQREEREKALTFPFVDGFISKPLTTETFNMMMDMIPKTAGNN